MNPRRTPPPEADTAAEVGAYYRDCEDWADDHTPDPHEYDDPQTEYAAKREAS